MDVNKIPFKDFFEDSLKTLYENKPKSVAIVAILETGDVFTGYCNTTVFDKALMSNAILQDQTTEVIRANMASFAQEIKRINEEEETDDELWKNKSYVS